MLSTILWLEPEITHFDQRKLIWTKTFMTLAFSVFNFRGK